MDPKTSREPDFKALFQALVPLAGTGAFSFIFYPQPVPITKPGKPKKLDRVFLASILASTNYEDFQESHRRVGSLSGA